MDFTNLFQDYTVGDGTAQVVYHSPFDQSFVIFNDSVVGDLTDIIQSYRVPVWSRYILCDEIPKFFRTSTDGLNEWVSQSIYMLYGNYVYDLLKIYHGFGDSFILSILKLILAWVMRNLSDDLALEEVNDLLGNLTGSDKATG